VERAFFPLDDELELLPGSLTPSLQESLVRLGVWMPFGRAATEFEYFTRTDISRPTAERVTEAAGAAYVAVQTAEVEHILKDLPPAPAGPDKQFLSVDGAFVPLVGGEWAEVKTMAIGEVMPPVQRKEKSVIETRHLSYFSRLTDSDTFQRLALVETHRRGVENAAQVGTVTDGAEWIQKFVDFHCPTAVRILDFPHAAEYIALIGKAVWGEGTDAMKAWLATQLHQLKHEGPTAVLAELRAWVKKQPEPTDLKDALTYLEKRELHMQYPAFQAAGWPIGDGAVESANKLVVEARLKGSGMHWARPHVNPMLALRNIVCNDQWAQAWPQIVLSLRQRDRQRRTERRQRRRAQCTTTSHLEMNAVPTRPDPSPLASATPSVEPVASGSSDDQPARSKSVKPYRPPADHPWRHMPVGRARFKRNSAKT
jgi:hypothetical protein